jgi:hypothetical protein
MKKPKGNLMKLNMQWNETLKFIKTLSNENLKRYNELVTKCSNAGLNGHDAHLTARDVLEDEMFLKKRKVLEDRKENQMKIIAILNYTSVEPDGFSPTCFKFRKEFVFENIPSIECRIILKDDILKHLSFRDVTFDPYKNAYIIYHEYSECVERYYGYGAEAIMRPIVEKIIKYGWELIGESI